MDYVHIRIDSLQNHTDEQLNKLYTFLGEGRKREIDKISLEGPKGSDKKHKTSNRNRDQKILASDLLEQELMEFGIFSPKEYRKTEHGKPYLKDRGYLAKSSSYSVAPGGLTSDGIDFSISHSGDLAAIALVTGGLVGIDVEDLHFRRKSVEELQKMAERYFLPEEIAWMNSEDTRNWREQDEALSQEERYTRAFYRIWTWKEAYSKAYDIPLQKVLRESVYRMDDAEAVQILTENSVLTVVTPGRTLQMEDILLRGSFEKRQMVNLK